MEYEMTHEEFNKKKEEKDQVIIFVYPLFLLLC